MSKTDEKSGSESSLSQKSPFVTQMEDPTETLDEYGVWVKSGPEPVEDEVFEIEEDNQLKDLPESSSMELTSEEEELLGSLETEERPMQTLSQEEGEKTGLEDIEVEEEALDLDFGEIPELDTLETAGFEAKEGIIEKPSSIEGLDDLEDFELEEDTFESEEEEEEGQTMATLPTAEEEVESFKMEEPILEVEEELPELELEEPSERAQEGKTLEKVEATEESSLEMSVESMGDVPKEEEEESTTNIEPSPMEETPVQFNDVEAVAQAMGGGTDIQMDILTKIEEELAEIKNELAELKRELSSLRPSAPLPVVEEMKEIPHPVKEEEEGAGFFEEDEDETIALTGDELDNILNTADITEETGEPSAVPEDLELEPMVEEAAPEAMIPVTTPEEQAIIEEYNKELERFTANEIPFEVEDRIDQEAVEALPEEVLEKDDLFEVEQQPKQEPFVMEKPAPETVPTLTDLVYEDSSVSEKPATEETIFEETIEQTPLSTAPTPEQVPSVEEGVIEFDLESLEEVEEVPEETKDEVALEFEEEIEATKKAEEPKQAFEEELEEMEVSLPEEGVKAFELDEALISEEPKEAEIPELEEVEAIPEEAPIVPLEEPMPELHIPEEEPEETKAPTRQTVPSPRAEETTKRPSFTSGMPESLREEIKAVLKYMDQLLEALPEEKIQEFARSEHFDVYRKLFEELGLE